MAIGFKNKTTVNVLLLGATGSLGSCILEALLKKPFINVTAVVRSRDKLNSILSTRQRLYQAPEASPLSSHDLVSIYGQQLSVIEGNATEPGVLVQTMRDKSIQILVNAAGHAPMFARSSSSLGSDKEIKDLDSNNEVARIARATVDAIDEAGNSTQTSIDEKKVRGWFIGGMLLLDYPESTGASNTLEGRDKIRSLDHYLPLYLYHRPLESILKSSKHLDWTLVCPAKMISRPRLPNSPTLSSKESQPHASPALIASSDIPPKWSVWPSLRAIPWGIGPLLEIIVNSARYTVTFEDVAEFIVNNIVYECEFQHEQDISKKDNHQTQVQDPVTGLRRRVAENNCEKSVWVEGKIGLIASSDIS